MDLVLAEAFAKEDGGDVGAVNREASMLNVGRRDLSHPTRKELHAAVPKKQLNERSTYP